MFRAIKSGAISRRRAFLTHFAASSTVVTSVVLVIYVFWYPGDLFAMAGVWAALQVLIFVDVVLGPSLTLLLFKPGKPGLVFDISVILAVQVVALIYGVTIIYKERPYFLVFAVDRYELISQYEVDMGDLNYESLVERPVDDVIHVFARRPEDPEEFSLYTESVMSGQPDLERRPEFWYPYVDGKNTIIENAWSLDYLRSLPHADEDVIDRAVQKYAADSEKIGYLPVSSKRLDYSMIIDLETAEPLGIIRLYPWDDYEQSKSEGWLSSIIGAK